MKKRDDTPSAARRSCLRDLSVGVVTGLLLYVLSNYYQYTVHSSVQGPESPAAAATEYPGLTPVETPTRSHRVKSPPPPKAPRVKPPPPEPEAKPPTAKQQPAPAHHSHSHGHSHGHSHATNTEHYLREPDKQAERDMVTDELRRESRRAAAAGTKTPAVVTPPPTPPPAQRHPLYPQLGKPAQEEAQEEQETPAQELMEPLPEDVVEAQAGVVVDNNGTGRQNFTNWTLMGLSSADVELKEMNRFMKLSGETEKECVRPRCLCKFTDVGCRQRWCERNRRVTMMPMKALGFPVSASDRANGHFNILDFIRYREGGKFSKEAPAEFFPKRENVFKGVSWANATCAIVGNSGTLNVKPYGKTIDSHDIVIRMNQAPTAGYESDCGSKTTIRLLNSMWSNNYGIASKIKAYDLPLEPGVALIVSRGEAVNRNYLGVVRHMRKQRSDVGVYMIQQRVVSKSKALLATYRNCAASAGRPEFGGGRVPSSGLVAVYALKNLCKSLTAYGFGSHRDANYQYYKLHGTQRSSGNPTHSFGAEYSMLRNMAKENMLRLCGISGCYGKPAPQQG